MKQKIFGVGWGKTGTKTLGECFKLLGYKHHSLDMDLTQSVISKEFGSVYSRADDFDTFDDLPWNILYEELDKWFPNSKFVLTTRSSDQWVRSYRNMVQRQALVD